jgi:hypothetical protein
MSLDFASFTTTFPEQNVSKPYFLLVWFSIEYWQLVRHELKGLPPQQKPAAPIAETPWLFRAASTGLASSYPFSYTSSKDNVQY